MNPFAPVVDYGATGGGNSIADLKHPEDVFQNMQYAYTNKDTLVYGGFLSQQFTFTYRDYDLGFDVSWGREDDMRTTYGLFNNTERLDLVWNNIVVSTVDSTEANYIRGFNLTITFNPNDIVRVAGRANFIVKKDSSSGIWQIYQWIDQSNF